MLQNVKLLEGLMSKTLRVTCTILHPILDPVVCVICAKQAKIDAVDSANKEFFHWINFLFVKGDYQVRTVSHLIDSKTVLFCIFILYIRVAKIIQITSCTDRNV